MAYDPDLQPVIDNLQAQIDALKSSGTGTGGILNTAAISFNAALYMALIAAPNTAAQAAILDTLTVSLAAP